MNTRKPLRITLLLIIGAAVVVGIVLGTSRVVKFTVGAQEEPYNAVFLDNGQVYFGKVSDKKSTYVRLTDVYYLQSKQVPEGQADVTLVKLGSELHGPKDEMQILRDHVLYIEELSSSSRVVEAIKEYEKNNEN